jgi:16S rRNA G966 N2-methylase RsmD
VSRGCAHVISVELDRDHHRFIQDCLKKLGTDTCVALRGDVFRFIKSCKHGFDFIFADPPYALKELSSIPSLIFEKGLLKEGGIFVLEHGKDQDFTADPHFVEHRSYGSVNFSIFRTTETTGE